jgi:hypothetical protein
MQGLQYTNYPPIGKSNVAPDYVCETEHFATKIFEETKRSNILCKSKIQEAEERFIKRR